MRSQRSLGEVGLFVFTLLACTLPGRWAGAAAANDAAQRRALRAANGRPKANQPASVFDQLNLWDVAFGLESEARPRRRATVEAPRQAPSVAAKVRPEVDRTASIFDRLNLWDIAFGPPSDGQPGKYRPAVAARQTVSQRTTTSSMPARAGAPARLSLPPRRAGQTILPVAWRDGTASTVLARAEHAPAELTDIHTDGAEVIVDGVSSCPPPQPLLWVFGAEATFLAPNFNAADVRYVVADLTVPETRVFSVDDTNSLAVAPRLWLGIQGPCWGVVGRYWHLRNAGADYDPFQVPQIGTETGLLANSQFDAYAVDLELTRVLRFYDSKLTASVGTRYASLSQSNSILALASVDDDIITGSARSARTAYGTGLTAGLAGRHPLFTNSCAKLFYNLRGSVLWGSSSVGVETSSSVVDPTASAGANNGAVAFSTDPIYIGEVQLGIEWDYPLACLPANAFFRVAAEYQYWDAGSGDAFATSFADEVGVVETTATAAAGGIRMHLVGLALGAGFTW